MIFRYYNDDNIPVMMAILVPLHEEIERGASTALEKRFLVRCCVWTI